MGHKSADCHKRNTENRGADPARGIQVPLKLICMNEASGTVQVKGIVDERSCSMTVDTGVE